MAFFHHEQFIEGTAKVLQGESLKARPYVTHALSLGILREKMVGSLIRDETPERFKVETGLIRNHDRHATSRQCDLLIHESQNQAPLYRWEDFVVVHDTEARAVIEVKSNLNKEGFSDVLKIHRSVLKLERSGVFIPTFGYGLKGVNFESVVKYVRSAVRKNKINAQPKQRHLNWPFCIAIQQQNLIGIRPLVSETDRPFHFCVVDLKRVTDKEALLDGLETGFFLQLYLDVLKGRSEALIDGVLYTWLNDLPIKDDAKAWVSPDGEVGTGRIGFERVVTTGDSAQSS